MHVKVMWRAMAVVVITSAAGLHGAAAAPASQSAAPKLRSIQVLTMDGVPFPTVLPYVTSVPQPHRTFFAASGKEQGDGSKEHPWNDLQAALQALEAGDRLEVLPGRYKLALLIDERCHNGTASAPVQLFFDAKAIVQPASGAAITVAREHWYIHGAYLKLDQKPAGGVTVRGAASSVTLDRLRVSGGTAPAVNIERGASRVTVCNALLDRHRLHGDSAAIGILIAAGTESITLVHNQLRQNGLGSVRVEAPAGQEPPASNVEIAANTLRDDTGTALSVKAARGLRIVNNTFVSDLDSPDSRGIVLENVHDAVVSSNHLMNYAVGIQVGVLDPATGESAPAEVTRLDRNDIETSRPGGVAVDVEAGHRITFVKNVCEGYDDGIVILGQRPSIDSLTVANNLFLDVGRTAFVLRDTSVASLFDYNAFSPAGLALSAQVGKRMRPLATVLRSMPHSHLARHLSFANRDLARIEGLETRDRGTPADEMAFSGSAPDLGIAEH